jgi:peptidoglycan/xylan/chitin deacetylase (PgdA/CDA1 family)
MVIGYHRVADRADGMTVRLSVFAEQICQLAADRARVPVVDVDELMQRPAAGWPPRSVAVTIDDAWADVHTNALSVLASAAIPATLYVPTTLLGTGEYMTHGQLRECVAAGVGVGGHSRSHADLRRCGAVALEREVRGCREDLEDLLGQPVTSFAYPFGYVDARVRDAVAAAGYTTAVTTRRRWVRPGSDPLLLPRNMIENFDAATFGAALSGGLNVLRLADAGRSAGRAGLFDGFGARGGRRRHRRGQP